MTIGYTREHFEEKFTELEKLDKNTDEYFYKYLKFMISFGRATIITEKGIEKAKELHKRWKNGEELNREDSITCGFLLSDVCILEDDTNLTIDVGELYDEMLEKHNPDFGYMQSFCQTHMLELEYVEPNPRYMNTIEQMFIHEHIEPNQARIDMVNSGEMPRYNKEKICPYCGEQFKDLFKHVNFEHKKK